MEYFIPLLVAAGIAVTFLSRKPDSGNMPQDPAGTSVKSREETVRLVRATFLKARMRLMDLRKERKRIVEDYAKQADALKAAQVRKDLDSI